MLDFLDQKPVILDPTTGSLSQSMLQEKYSIYPSDSRLLSRKIPEKIRSAYLLGDFDACNSRGAEFIKEVVGGNEISRNGLISLAVVFAQMAGISVQRDYTRRRALLVKWFDQHVDELLPFIDYVSIESSFYHEARTITQPIIDPDFTDSIEAQLQALM